MDKTLIFKSITEELSSLKNRVRNFIGDVHWLSDGEWKESVLKSVIRRHIPANIGVGSGFIVNENECTSQIDILLYDLNKPILFRDGDFVIITPDAVMGIIEVKTKVESINKFEDYVKKLYKNIEFVRNNKNLEYIYAGLFSYETKIDATTRNLEKILEILLKYSFANGYISNINHISLGNNIFIRFWYENPIIRNEKDYYTWHGYELIDMSPAYFIMNTVVESSGYFINGNSNLLFPPEGKEGNILAKLKMTI